ncbi:AAA family ATPase [Desulfonatronum thioautotrophicum]|uniref:AAA family ATPase n=1 Tax=Desulfonatronum thioautotrophicum TaxID=617001 RepID=UPI0005EBACB6|nr:AAA family ATPase [Desulfonatronum thioautotrophicum]
MDAHQSLPIVFLLGPPGSGKSSLGKAACRAIGLRFLDLSTPAVNQLPLETQQAILTEALEKEGADVIALPWTLQREVKSHAWLRRSGMLLALWAHPLEMQERSGSSQPLFTPSRRLKDRSGFGRGGTSCLEFRMLDRSVDATLKLVRIPFDKACHALRNSLERMRKKPAKPPILQFGLDDLVESWSKDYSVKKSTTHKIVDAMARYLVHLRAEGKSARKISEVIDDLEIAGLFLVQLEVPKVSKRLNLAKLFAFPPNTTDFKRAFIDSDIALDRYESNLKGFVDFLKKDADQTTEI